MPPVFMVADYDVNFWKFTGFQNADVANNPMPTLNHPMIRPAAMAHSFEIAMDLLIAYRAWLTAG